MKICFVCVEIFAWNKFGGFGRATRIIGRELAKRGIEVFAVVPKREGQKTFEKLDGITILGFPFYMPWSSIRLFKMCDADIYHSQEPSLATYLAMKAMPNKEHIINFRDPRDFNDWKIEFSLPSRNKLQVLSNYFYEDNFLVRRAVRRADGLYCAAKQTISKVKAKYGLKSNPGSLLTPVAIPDKVQKSTAPMVCFLSRFDRRKRPALFFELAKQYPTIKFVAVGQSQDRKWDAYLRERYGSLSNLEMTGFIDQFSSNRLFRLLEQSWILINTASREGLPTSFLEALAHRCAILSSVNPDGVTEHFGYHVRDNDFAKGLDHLLTGDIWKKKGERGYEYVKEDHELGKVVDQHVLTYRKLVPHED